MRVGTQHAAKIIMTLIKESRRIILGFSEETVENSKEIVKNCAEVIRNSKE